MPVEIRVGEPHLTSHQGHAVLVSDADGMIRSPSQKGLFFRDTRLISDWKPRIEGELPILLNSANETYWSAKIVLVNPRLSSSCGDVKKHTIGLTISRAFGPGMHEDAAAENEQVQRVEPGHAGAEEHAKGAGHAGSEITSMDVRDDESAQQKEQVDRKVALADNVRVAFRMNVREIYRRIVIEHDPQAGDPTQWRERR